MGEGSVPMRVEKVLALLIESGFLYCCLWVRITEKGTGTYAYTRELTIRMQVLYLISAFRVFPEPGFVVMDSVLLFASVSRAGFARMARY